MGEWARNTTLTNVWNKISSILPHALKQIYRPWVVVKKRVAFIAGAKQGVWAANALKDSKLPSGFQGKVFKDRVRERGCRECNQLMDIVLIAWWWGHGRQHHQPGSNRSGGYVLVGSIVNFFHLVAVSVSTKQLRGQGSEYLSSGLGEELKAFDFVERLNYHFVLHDCFPLFLHFFTSLFHIIYSLELGGGPGG